MHFGYTIKCSSEIHTEINREKRAWCIQGVLFSNNLMKKIFLHTLHTENVDSKKENDGWNWVKDRE